ncbi:hypothetical protein D3C71_1050610 [compost metagenome]
MARPNANWPASTRVCSRRAPTARRTPASPCRPWANWRAAPPRSPGTATPSAAPACSRTSWATRITSTVTRSSPHPSSYRATRCATKARRSSMTRPRSPNGGCAGRARPSMTGPAWVPPSTSSTAKTTPPARSTWHCALPALPRRRSGLPRLRPTRPGRSWPATRGTAPAMARCRAPCTTRASPVAPTCACATRPGPTPTATVCSAMPRWPR